MNVGRTITGVAWLLFSTFALAGLLQASATSGGLAGGLLPLILFAGCAAVFLGMYVIGTVFSWTAATRQASQRMRDAVIYSSVRRQLQSQTGLSELIFLYRAHPVLTSGRVTVDVDSFSSMDSRVLDDVIQSMVLQFRDAEASSAANDCTIAPRPPVSRGTTVELFNISELEWRLQSCR